MTIMEALHRIDAVKPNGYSQQEKVQWLSALDGLIKTQIIDAHECAEEVVFAPYTEDTDLKQPLLVPAPYDEIYLFWLESKIDYWNGEIGKYNNSIAMYNSAFSAFERYWGRTHKPKTRKFNFFGKQKSPELEAVTSVAKVSVEED